MNEQVRDDLITLGFMLGVRLTEHVHEIERSPDAQESLNAALRAVADGELSLGDTPAEMRMKFPELDTPDLESAYRRSVAHTADHAASVIRSLERRDVM